MSDLSVFFQSVKLPVMPEVAHALIRTLHEEDIVLGDVRNIISKDPTLTAKVLRAANSAAMGLRREVNSLDTAIAMIGMAQVRTLALTACMNVAFPVAEGLNRTEFWKGSMACAGYAQWLAGTVGLDGQEAWLAGMMVRLGELLIVQSLPDSLATIERQPQLPGERWKREQQLLGFTEAQVTAELARRWRFPAGIARALDTAADPLTAQPFSTLGAVLHLAGWLADMPFVEPEIMDVLPQTVVSRLDLNREWLRSHMPSPDSFFDISGL